MHPVANFFEKKLDQKTLRVKQPPQQAAKPEIGATSVVHPPHPQHPLHTQRSGSIKHRGRILKEGAA